jgi:hypothetical protein
MNKAILVFLLASLLAPVARGEDDPFAPLLKHLQGQDGEWSTDNAEVARVFHRCARAITNDYRGAVLRFLGTNLERHYWISSYLVDKPYLHGTKPDADLALLILCQATKITPRDDDELVLALGVRVRLAVLAKMNGFDLLAASQKAAATQMVRSNQKLQGGVMPAMDDAETRIYEGITTRPKEE